jgi:hypothetical protein
MMSAVSSVWMYLLVTDPSEGKGHTFESCRVRHKINDLAEQRRCE